MDKTEFAKRLKSAKIEKRTSINGARGYTVTVDRNGKPFTCTIYSMPNQKGKLAYKEAYGRMVDWLAQEWGYTGETASFK